MLAAVSLHACKFLREELSTKFIKREYCIYIFSPNSCGGKTITDGFDSLWTYRFSLFFLENVSVGLPTWKYFWLASKVKKLVLMKLYHIPQKGNFHEKIFENLAIPRGVVLFLELKKKNQHSQER